MRIAAIVLVLALHPVGISCAAESAPVTPKSDPSSRVTQASQSKAVLYEEDQHDPHGRQSEGSAVWRTERVAPGSGQSARIAVQVQVEIPDRGVSVRGTLSHNDDKSLPASHTIRLVFTLAPDFSHGNISRVPGILVKQGAWGRGTPLAGISVKGGANTFLIGLSSFDADAQRNLRLVKENTWFDVPVVFGDGKRAILAIEKGAGGENALAEAFAAWGDAVAKTLPSLSPPPASPSPSAPPATSGTGFFVTDHGRVVTAAHVVDGCSRIAIRYGGATRTARLDRLERTNDVALLSTDVTPLGVAKLRPGVRLGEDVVVYGFPLSGVLAKDGNVTTGIVTALAGILDDNRMLQLSAPVQKGNSGGPVLDRSGNVVGIVVSKLNVARFAEQLQDTPQNVNFAVKSLVALTVLRAWDTSVAEGQTGPEFSTPDLVDRAKAFTVNVICERPAVRPTQPASLGPSPNKPPPLEVIPGSLPPAASSHLGNAGAPQSSTAPIR